MKNCRQKGRWSKQGIFEEGVVYEHDGLKVTAFFVDHGLVKPAMGYRVDFWRSFGCAVRRHAAHRKNLVRWAMGTDLLIHEVIDTEAFIQERGKLFRPEGRAKPNHWTSHDAGNKPGQYLATVKPKLAVYSPRDSGKRAELCGVDAQDLFWAA